jgi:putative transposase
MHRVSFFMFHISIERRDASRLYWNILFQFGVWLNIIFAIQNMIMKNTRILFRGKYRIPSTRLLTWNYASAGLYFITICTKNRRHYFGEVIQGEVHLSALGYIVFEEWMKTPIIRQDMNLQLGEYVVMPNHFHAIIGIGPNNFNSGTVGRDAMHRVSTNTTNTTHQNSFGPQFKNLASIICGFKSIVTTYAKRNSLDFQWQPGYHDHIIRNETAFQNISHYIQNNPINWQKDSLR